MTDSDPDAALHSATPEKTSDPLIRPSTARAELTRLGIDGASIPAMFRFLKAHGLRFTANGPGRFRVGIDRWQGEPRDLVQIATADGETFGNALAVALWVAIDNNRDILASL